MKLQSLQIFYEKMKVFFVALAEASWEYLSENIGLKIIAFIIAVALWGAVSKQETAQITLQNVRLEYANLPEELDISNSDFLESATVRVRGSKDLLEKLRSEGVTIRVDLTQTKPGERVVQLSATDVLLPANIEVIDIEPQRTHLTIERVIERQVKVVPRFIGDVPKDYEMTSYSVAPSSITIKGAESRVGLIEEAPTETIRLTDHRSNFVERLNIDIKDLKVKILGSPAIEVRVQIGQIRTERSIDNIKVKLLPPNSKVKLKPSVVRIEVEGLRSLITELKPEEVSAFVDMPEDESLQVTPRIMLPPTLINDVKIKRIDPPQIEVRSLDQKRRK
ncbi:MAG: hypothetical protein JNN15_09610 [Blastocatellia bacterium]|nr:hypothetical protein [Blastocatellia bacterium]